VVFYGRRCLSDGDKTELLTIDETAEFLRVSDKTVRRMLNDGRLKGVNIGKAVEDSEGSPGRTDPPGRDRQAGDPQCMVFEAVGEPCSR